MSKIQALIIAVLVILTSCQKNKATSESHDAKVDEYGKRYSIALRTDDAAYIESTVRFMDERIAERDAIASIRYNKAQLLFRLRRYDEAVATMKQSKQPYDAIYLATLLLRLGRVDEGHDMLRRLLEESKKTLYSEKVDEKSALQRVQGVVVILNLLGEDDSAFLREVAARNILLEKELSGMKTIGQMSMDEILQNMWPD